jgi:hypothetical protein
VRASKCESVTVVMMRTISLLGLTANRFLAHRAGPAVDRNIVLDGARSVIDRELSAPSHEGSDVARGRSTLVVILSRLSCLVASHHCFCAPCERIEGVREQTGEGSGGQ